MEVESYLPISGLQHLVFCARQCALIHVDREWKENTLTAEGRVVHSIVDGGSDERRGELAILRSLPLRSDRLRVHGLADAVESYTGTLRRLVPVEYKRSRYRSRAALAFRANEVQLCAQAFALEEMFGCVIDSGALFFHASRKRYDVVFTDELRRITADTAARFHELVKSAKLPPPHFDKRCPSCSLIEVCRPAEIEDHSMIRRYVARLFVPE